MYYAKGLNDPSFRLRDWRPEGEVVFNERHWLAPKIKTLFVPDNARHMIDLINPGLIPVSTAGQIADGRWGRAPTFTDGGASFKATAQSPFAAGWPANLNLSFLAAIEMRATTINRNIFLCGGPTGENQNGGLNTENTGGTTRFVYAIRAANGGALGAASAASGSHYSLNVPVLVGSTSTANNAHALYVDGASVGTGSTDVGSSRSSLPNIGTGNIIGTNNTNAASGLRHLLALFSPALTAEDHARLYDESPFDLIRPKIERSWHFLGTVGGGEAGTIIPQIMYNYRRRRAA